MPESLVTRPLRTGRNFRVVIPQHVRTADGRFLTSGVALVELSQA